MAETKSAPTVGSAGASAGQANIHESPTHKAIVPLPGQKVKNESTTALVIVERKGGFYADSRNVAEWVGKRHDHLIRDIDGYCDDLQNPTLGNADNKGIPRPEEFFIPGKFKAETGNGMNRQYRLYWITRKGCEFVANKLTGRKGTLFTAAYIERFHQMEQLLELRTECPALTEAIAWRHENPQAYHFSNEFDMINRIALGMKAKQFKAAHAIDPSAGSIRPYLTPEELGLVNILQRVDIGLVYAGLSAEQREGLLRQRAAEARLVRLAGRGRPS